MEDIRGELCSCLQEGKDGWTVKDQKKLQEIFNYVGHDDVEDEIDEMARKGLADRALALAEALGMEDAARYARRVIKNPGSY